jgi:integrase
MGLYRRKGSPHWWYSFRHDGKRIYASTGVTDHKAAKQIYVIRRNKHILRKERDELAPLKIGELLETYLRDYARDKTTVHKDKAACKRLSDFFGDRQAAEITPQLIEQFKNYRRQKTISGRPVTGATVNRDLACLKTAFSKAVQWGLVSSNPVKMVKLYSEKDRARTRYLSPEEKARLLAVCSPELRRIVLAALKTGMRKSELLTLRWLDVDFGANQIKIRKSKSGRIRFIPLHPDVLEILKDLPKSGDYIFTGSRGDALTLYGWVRTQFEAALDKTGIRNFKFHDLRHTFASEMIMRGADLKTVSELLGHATTAMTERYSHLSPAHKNLAINLLSQEGKAPLAMPKVLQELGKGG